MACSRVSRNVRSMLVAKSLPLKALVLQREEGKSLRIRGKALETGRRRLPAEHSFGRRLSNSELPGNLKGPRALVISAGGERFVVPISLGSKFSGGRSKRLRRLRFRKLDT